MRKILSFVTVVETGPAPRAQAKKLTAKKRL